MRAEVYGYSSRHGPKVWGVREWVLETRGQSLGPAGGDRLLQGIKGTLAASVTGQWGARLRAKETAVAQVRDDGGLAKAATEMMEDNIRKGL